METKDFIIELEKKDMKLWLNEEGGLAFKGPKNFMTDDLLNQIKERKEEIVECLKRERFINVNVNIKMIKKWKIKMYIFQDLFLSLCFHKGSFFF